MVHYVLLPSDICIAYYPNPGDCVAYCRVAGVVGTLVLIKPVGNQSESFLPSLDFSNRFSTVIDVGANAVWSIRKVFDIPSLSMVTVLG